MTSAVRIVRQAVFQPYSTASRGERPSRISSFSRSK
jgi:hypothetical protein